MGRTSGRCLLSLVLSLTCLWTIGAHAPWASSAQSRTIVIAEGGAGGGSDIVPPSPPVELRADAFPDRIVLRWSLSKDPKNPEGNAGSAVRRYLVSRNGTALGVALTVLYDDNTVEPDATYTYIVRAVDRAGNMSAASAPQTIRAAPAFRRSVARIDIPIRQWIALRMPVRGAIPGGMKHVTPSYNPDNGRIYFTGGDFGMPPAIDSYRQDTYSLSLLERWSNPDNPNAGWRLEYPYCGPEGQVQPKHPDYVGFPWDSKRRVFWMVPGLMMAVGTEVCLNETPGYANNAGFIHDQLMTFDPASRTWAPQGGFFGKGATWDVGWQSIYDAVTDSLIRLHDDSVDTYAIATKTWSRRRLGVKGRPVGQNVSGKSLRLGMGYNAFDPAQRVIYSIDPVENGLYRYHVDGGALDPLGPLPALYAASKAHEAQFKLVWDSLHNVLYWHNHLSNGFFAFHPDTGTWETLGTATNIPGVEAVASNAMVFDPGQNVLLMFGDVWGPPGSAQAAARPFMFLYRYGP